MDAVFGQRFVAPLADEADLRQAAPEVVVFPAVRDMVVSRQQSPRPLLRPAPWRRCSCPKTKRSRVVRRTRITGGRVAKMLDRRIGISRATRLDRRQQASQHSRQQPVVGVERQHVGRVGGVYSRRSGKAQGHNFRCSGARAMRLKRSACACRPASRDAQRIVGGRVRRPRRGRACQGLRRGRVESLGHEPGILCRGRRSPRRARRRACRSRRPRPRGRTLGSAQHSR